MNIAIVGTGYVGLVSGACFAEMGANVYCIDIDEEKIAQLKQGKCPIYEPQLEELLESNIRQNRLSFHLDILEVLDKVDIVFSAVGTPPDEDGSADLSYVIDVAEKVAKNMNKYILFVTKSTVPVGTAVKIREIISKELKKRNLDIEFDVASNPEFLKEGSAVKDFMSPDRVVVGVDSEKARGLMERLYRPFMLKSFRVIFTDIASAEMIKYAANSMLATRISFMNEIANLCELVGADINMVRKGIGSDTRIGNQFLYAGCGYGGSCFPKDIKALIKSAENLSYDTRLLKAVEAVNEEQKLLLFKKLSQYYKSDLCSKLITIWGLSFKPDTDDMRQATSLVIIEELLKSGAKIKVYDPIAMPEAKRRYGDQLIYAKDIYEAVEDSSAIMLLTEWKQFRMPSWQQIYSLMKEPLVLDGRNIYSAKELKELGFTYINIGSKS